MNFAFTAVLKTGTRHLIYAALVTSTFYLHAQPASRDSLSRDSITWNSPNTVFNNSPWRNSGIVKNDERQSVPYETPEQLFAGRVAGVQVMETNGSPGGEFSVRVRGTSSLMRSSEPLYVVDGFPMEFFSKNLDALIDQQPGKGKPVNGLALINPSDIESIEVIKNASALAVYGIKALNGVVLINTKHGSRKGLHIDFETSMSLQQMARKKEMLNTVEYVEFKKKIGLQYPSYSYISTAFPEPASSYPNVDWMDEITRNGSVQRHQIELNGGIGHLRFFLQGGLYNHQGLVKGSGFSRKSIRVNVDMDFWKNRIRVGASHYYASAATDVKSMEGWQTTAPIGPVYNQDGTFHRISIGDYDFSNPLQTVLNTAPARAMDRMMFNNYMKIAILKSLSVTSRYATSFVPSDFFFSSGNATSFSISYGEVRDRFWENTIDFSKSMGWFRLHLAGGYINQSYKGEWAYVTGDEKASRTYIHALKGKGILSIDGPRSPSGISTINQLQMSGITESAFIQSAFDIGSALRASFNFRKDFYRKSDYPGSDSFGGGLVWNLSNMLKTNKDKLSSLKLYLDLGQLAQLNYWRGYSSKPPEYKKVNRKNLSVGAEAQFFSERFLVELDLFNQVSRKVAAVTKMFLPTQPFGYQDYFTEVDKMENRGVDLSIRGVLVATGNLRWSVSANGSFVVNKIKNLGLYYISSDSKNSKRPVSSWFLRKNDGVWNTEQEIQNEYKGLPENRPVLGSARYSEPSMVYSGSANPNVLYGISSELSWSKFDCSILLRGESGQRIMNLMDNRLSLGTGYNNISEDALKKMWSLDNPGGNFPGYGKASYSDIPVSDWFLQNGSFLRLQNVSLGYTTPILKGSQNIRFYLSGQNLFLLTKYEGWDPEVNSNGQEAWLRGSDNGAYPRARTFTIGMQVHL